MVVNLLLIEQKVIIGRSKIEHAKEYVLKGSPAVSTNCTPNAL